MLPDPPTGPRTENQEILGTPFRLQYHEDHGWFITLGQHRVTEFYPERSTALNQMPANTNWQFMVNIMVTIAQQTFELLTPKKPE